MNKIKKIYILSFIFSLHIAVSAYVNSTFLTKFFNEDYIGILYTVASVLTLFIFSQSAKILKHIGNRRLILIFLIINMISLIGLITSSIPYIIGASFVLFSLTNTLVLFCIDIFIEHFSDRINTGKTRGAYLTIINTAYMLSPLIAAFMITKEGGYKAIYLLAFLMVALMTIGLVFSVKTFKDGTYKREPFFQTLKYLRINKHMFSIVFINLLLQFFFAWMVVYTPIYLINHLNFNWSQVGIIFTIMLAPFVFLGLPIGYIIDKYHVSKRKLLSIGFVIMILSTISISFMSSTSVIFWGIILFATRIGASIIETTGEIYFFSHITDEDAYLLGIYRDMYPVAYIIAPVIATLIFIILPFNYLFIILGIIMLSGFYFISKLKNNHINNEYTIPNANQ